MLRFLLPGSRHWVAVGASASSTMVAGCTHHVGAPPCCRHQRITPLCTRRRRSECWTFLMKHMCHRPRIGWGWPRWISMRCWPHTWTGEENLTAPPMAWETLRERAKRGRGEREWTRLGIWSQLSSTVLFSRDLLHTVDRESRSLIHQAASDWRATCRGVSGHSSFGLVRSIMGLLSWVVCAIWVLRLFFIYGPTDDLRISNEFSLGLRTLKWANLRGWLYGPEIRNFPDK
jgi:hypothetical protein